MMGAISSESAVAEDGWHRLNEHIVQSGVRTESPDPVHRLAITYVQFAMDNPALYRLMYECLRTNRASPDFFCEDAISVCAAFRHAVAGMSAAPGRSTKEMELASIAIWCASHGLAQLIGCGSWKQMKRRVGGENAFLEAVLAHLMVFPAEASRSGA